jgi:CO/xanthine dehydrogenase FAD-binding subunit
MFITKVDIKEGKALIIGSYSNTFRMGAITTLRTILRHA